MKGQNMCQSSLAKQAHMRAHHHALFQQIFHIKNHGLFLESHLEEDP